MKKRIIFFTLIVIIISPFILFLYKYSKIYPYLLLFENKDIFDKYEYKQSFDNQDGSLGNDIIYADDEVKQIIKSIELYIPKDKDWFNLDSEKELYKIIDKIDPKNDLVLIKEELLKYIELYLKYCKKNIKSSDYDYYISMGHYLPPRYETYKQTAIYWYLLSRLLEKKGDYSNSLKFSMAILYLARDWSEDYDDVYNSTNKILTHEINRIGCKSILIWASKPKPNEYLLSKATAKDLLEYVKLEYPVSFNLKYELLIFEKVMDENPYIKSNYKEYFDMIKSLKHTDFYKQMIDEIYIKPLVFIDKPLYEISNELNNYKNRLNTIFSRANDYKPINLLYNSPDNELTLYLLKLRNHNFVEMKLAHEQKLTEIELTAIALALNSYFSQYNKMPKNMEELAKWFGKELPKNRLTNIPYILDFKGSHILYNNGVNGITDLELDETDDIYFDFKM